MNQSNILEIRELTKCFEDTAAIRQLDLKLERGRVYGLIGRNGAGKTTLLKLIGGLLFPSGGEIEINSEWIQKQGDIAFGRAYNIKYFTQRIKDILETASYIYPNWKREYAKELIDRFELDVKKYYHKASSGMQTMTSLILALAADPQLLLLDEPYVGLDPVNREVFYDFLRKHYFDGEKTVVISSHMIKEIEGYFERAIMIDKGQLVLNEEIEDLKERSFIVQADAALAEFVERNFNIVGRETLGSRVTYYIYDKIKDSEKNQIYSMNGEIQSMDLQTLMVKMLTGKEKL